MNCKDAVEHLLEFLDGSMGPELRQSFDQHLSRCGVCQTLVAGYQKTSVLCKKALEQRAGADVADRLLSALRDKTAAFRSKAK